MPYVKWKITTKGSSSPFINQEYFDVISHRKIKARLRTKMPAPLARKYKALRPHVIHKKPDIVTTENKHVIP